MRRLPSLHRLLTERARRKAPTSVVQIGANDGTSSDPIYPVLIENDWPALLVEPIPRYFALLCGTYAARPNTRFVQAAVTDHCGEVSMHRFDPAAIDAGGVPEWGHGAASLYLSRTALGWERYRRHVGSETVPAITLAELIRRNRIASIVVLQIDAEGHDHAILKQLDFQAFHPEIINIEVVNLTKFEAIDCGRLLTANGYLTEKHGYDLLAVREGTIDGPQRPRA